MTGKQMGQMRCSTTPASLASLSQLSFALRLGGASVHVQVDWNDTTEFD